LRLDYRHLPRVVVSTQGTPILESVAEAMRGLAAAVWDAGLSADEFAANLRRVAAY
jgi:hypothetical protein